MTLGEVSAEDSLAVMAAYTKGDDRLHMAYSFELLTDDYSAAYIRQTVEALEASIGDGWPCWAIGNHDVQRVASRWGRGKQTRDMVKMLNAMLSSLRGSVCSYQGEELGLTEAPIEFHELQDPFGKTFWPMFKGRDGCRTPMPWEQYADFSGFSQVSPWLPIAAAHRALAVDLQEADCHSVLHGYRQFLAWRKRYPVLITGEIEFLDAPEPLLVFVRTLGEQKLLVCFNLLDTEIQWALKEVKLQQELAGHGLKTAQWQGDSLMFSAYASFYALLA